MREASNSPRRALIADDDEFFRLALTAILARLEFTDIMETASLDEAVARLETCDATQPVTLALFDLEMPGMSGASSLAAIRECFPHVLVAVVSGSTRRRDILVALEAGAHGYVPKGLGVGELSKALGIVMSGAIYVPRCLAEIGAAGQPRIVSAEPTANSPTGSDDHFFCREAGLTKRQSDVLKLITGGMGNKEIARELGLGEGTVKVHVAALLRTLNVSNRAAAAALGAGLLAGG